MNGLSQPQNSEEPHPPHLIIQYQIVGPENMHASNIIQTEQVKYMYTYTDGYNNN